MTTVEITGLMLVGTSCFCAAYLVVCYGITLVVDQVFDRVDSFALFRPRKDPWQ